LKHTPKHPLRNLLYITYCFIYYIVYDRGAVKFQGLDVDINFNISDYEEDLKHVWMDSSDNNCWCKINLRVAHVILSYLPYADKELNKAMGSLEEAQNTGELLSTNVVYG